MTQSCKKWGPTALPLYFAEVIFAFIYFVFVSRFIWGLVADGHIFVGILLVVLFHITFITCQASYFKVVFTDPGHVPDGFPEVFESNPNAHIDLDIESGGSFVGLTSETNKHGERRNCDKCAKVKPDRCHHCRNCNRCILKMDHHCPWVNNCVGFHNYKYFILFLTWTVITALFVAACFLGRVIDIFSQGGSDLLIVTAFIIATVFGLGLSVFAGTHYVYVLNNQTTIEVLEKKSDKKR